MQDKNYITNLTDHMATLTGPVLLLQPVNEYSRQLRLAGKKFVVAEPAGHVDYGSFECNSAVYLCSGSPSRAVLKAICEGLPEGAPLLLSINHGGQQGIPAQEEVVTKLFESGFRLTALPGHSEGFTRASSPVAARTAETDREMAVFYSAATQAVRFRPYEKGDETQILAMFKSVFRAQRSLEHWNWKYRDNPLGGGMITLAETDEGRLIGHYAAYPLPMHVSHPGQSFTTIHGGDVMTSPSARRIGVGPTSVLAQMTTHFYNRFLCGNFSWGFGFNTGKKRVMGSRYTGYRYLPEAPFYNTPVNALQLTQGDATKFTVRRIQEPTEELDHLFNRVADDYRILIERKARYLDWRYLSCPDKKHFMYGVWKDERLCGWGVFAKTGDGLFWGDALFERDEVVAATSSLLKFVLREHALDVGFIKGWFSPVPKWWTRVLLQLGLVREPEPDALAPMVMRFDSKFSMEEIEQNFYYTKGDSDLF